MEHFEQNRTPINPVKEKSVYVLHLDTTRILIIGSVVIGLIVFAYVGGSYSLKEKNTKPKLAANTQLMFPNDSMSVPAAPHSGELSALFDDKSANSKPIEDNKIMDLINDRPSELPISDNTTVILPITSVPVVQSAPKQAAPVRSTNAKPANNVNNRPANASAARPANNARPAVAKPANNARPTENAKPASQNTRKPASQTENARNRDLVEVSAAVPKKLDGFAIQMGSFDTEVRAKRMSDALKAEYYDSYIERARLNGRDVFRVKIGPISNKREAIDLLNELQEDDRYADCYIVQR